MYMASSTDQVRTFGGAIRLGSRAWPLEACPMDGGSIAVAGSRVATVWRRERSIYLVDGTLAERLLGVGEQPWVAMTSNGPVVTWIRKRGDTLYLLTPGASSPSHLASGAADPVVAVAPSGTGPVVVVWEARNGKEYSIMCEAVLN